MRKRNVLLKEERRKEEDAKCFSVVHVVFPFGQACSITKINEAPHFRSVSGTSSSSSCGLSKFASALLPLLHEWGRVLLVLLTRPTDLTCPNHPSPLLPLFPLQDVTDPTGGTIIRRPRGEGQKSLPLSSREGRFAKYGRGARAKMRLLSLLAVFNLRKKEVAKRADRPLVHKKKKGEKTDSSGKGRKKCLDLAI